MKKEILVKLDEFCNKQIELVKECMKDMTDFKVLPDLTASVCDVVETYAEGLGCKDEDEVTDYVENFSARLLNLFRESFLEINPKKLILGSVSDEDVEEVSGLIEDLNDDMMKAAFVAYTIDGLRGMKDFVKTMKPFANASMSELANMLKFMSLLNGGLKK